LANPSTVLFLCSGNYYRSRFAELLFNHLVVDTGLSLTADSAGLWPNCRQHNSGPISADTLAALRARGVTLPARHRVPRDVTEPDIRDAAVTVALKEAEHRPMLAAAFAGWENRVTYWHVHDIDQSHPKDALGEVERLVRELIRELGAYKDGGSDGD